MTIERKVITPDFKETKSVVSPGQIFKRRKTTEISSLKLESFEIDKVTIEDANTIRVEAFGKSNGTPVSFPLTLVGEKINEYGIKISNPRRETHLRWIPNE